jgi:uncharacterized membrane protein
MRRSANARISKEQKLTINIISIHGRHVSIRQVDLSWIDAVFWCFLWFVVSEFMKIGKPTTGQKQELFRPCFYAYNYKYSFRSCNVK